MTYVVSLEFYRAVASVPKFVDIEIGLLELFENVTGVRFFETQCSII